MVPNTHRTIAPDDRAHRAQEEIPMKKNLTYVPAEKFSAIIAARSLETKEGKGFTRVTGRLGCRLYVANTKAVGRVDLQTAHGLEDGDANEVVPFCNITHQLDFARPEADILAAFERACIALDEAPAPAKKPRKMTAKVGALQARIAELEAELAARAAA